MIKWNQCPTCKRDASESFCDICGKPAARNNVQVPFVFRDSTPGEAAAGCSVIDLCDECYTLMRDAVASALRRKA